MATIKLNETSLASLPPPTEGAQAYFWDAEIPGFGVVVGRSGIKTFVARARVAGGKLTKVTIGIAGRVRDDGHEWTVKLARQRAKTLLGEMASGTNPNSGVNERRDAPTLRQGLALHIAEMQDAGKRPISIKTVEYDVQRLLSAWLDRPMPDLTVEAVQLLKEKGRKHKTQTNRLLAHLSAIWNTTRRLRRSSFHGENPVGRLGVQKYSLQPEQPRIEEEHMPEWLRRVEALSPLRCDLQLAALFTGMRTENVTKIRWEAVDWERGGLFVPRSKTTPFTIPLCKTVMEVLERRRERNVILFEAHGGDHGWVFPSLTSDLKRVIPVAEAKERRLDSVAPPWTKNGPKSDHAPAGERVLYLPGFHTLRRTYLSVAHECGVTKLDQHLLSNHAFGGRDVHDDYVRQAFPHLKAIVDSIDTAMWRRLRPEQTAIDSADVSSAA